MNQRHAAALALVGWYLMAPFPSALDETRRSHWSMLRAFDSAAGCDEGRDLLQKHAANDLRQRFGVAPNKDGILSAVKKATDTDELNDIMSMAAGLSSECISTDDPRLKEK
jgi:hypothetical protein